MPAYLPDTIPHPRSIEAAALPASPWDAFGGKSADMIRILNHEIVLKQPVNYAHYKINLKAPSALTWNFTDWNYYKNGELLVVLPSYHFNSAWKSAGTGEEWAQWINYDGYRAIFEGRSEHRRGMLLWMSHPAWPSMVVNYHASDHKRMEAKAQLINQDGSVQWEKKSTIDIKEDATVVCLV